MKKSFKLNTLSTVLLTGAVLFSGATFATENNTPSTTNNQQATATNTGYNSLDKAFSEMSLAEQFYTAWYEGSKAAVTHNEKVEVPKAPETEEPAPKDPVVPAPKVPDAPVVPPVTQPDTVQPGTSGDSSGQDSDVDADSSDEHPHHDDSHTEESAEKQKSDDGVASSGSQASPSSPASPASPGPTDGGVGSSSSSDGGSAPATAAQTSPGTQESVEPAEGAEPAKGAEPAEGAEPAKGAEPAEGAEPAQGTAQAGEAASGAGASGEPGADGAPAAVVPPPAAEKEETDDDEAAVEEEEDEGDADEEAQEETVVQDPPPGSAAGPASSTGPVVATALTTEQQALVKQIQKEMDFFKKEQLGTVNEFRAVDAFTASSVYSNYNTMKGDYFFTGRLGGTFSDKGGYDFGLLFGGKLGVAKGALALDSGKYNETQKVSVALDAMADLDYVQVGGGVSYSYMNSTKHHKGEFGVAKVDQDVKLAGQNLGLNLRLAKNLEVQGGTLTPFVEFHYDHLKASGDEVVYQKEVITEKTVEGSDPAQKVQVKSMVDALGVKLDTTLNSFRPVLGVTYLTSVKEVNFKGTALYTYLTEENLENFATVEDKGIEKPFKFNLGDKLLPGSVFRFEGSVDKNFGAVNVGLNAGYTYATQSEKGYGNVGLFVSGSF